MDARIESKAVPRWSQGRRGWTWQGEGADARAGATGGDGEMGENEMNLTMVRQIFGCNECVARLTDHTKPCPNRSVFDFFTGKKHYRGDSDGWGRGVWVGGEVFELSVPDIEGWNPMTSPPTVAGEYETINSITGHTQRLLKIIRSEGWWDGAKMWSGLVTHWREINE